MEKQSELSKAKQIDNNERGQWSSKIGFLMASIGSAVGLGNIWGFPYKMGANGGFAFLIIYLALLVFVGFAALLGEFTLGRMTGEGIIGTYRTLNKKFTFVGWFGVISAFLVISFYCVLGGFVLRYAVGFLMEIFSAGSGFGGLGSGEFFGSFIVNGFSSAFYFFIFLGLTSVIVMGGVKGGLEKFTTFAMPTLSIIMIIVIIKSLTLEGAIEGVKFMFEPNWQAFSEIGFVKILKTAAGQMFFSLSLGMGIMVIYGSYLSKQEDIQKSSIVIGVADTIFAVLAGLMIMPAVGAFMAQGVEGITYGAGPGLLFITMHQVFSVGMGGFMGNLFGFMFYMLVFFAAITSSISVLEVCIAFFVDKRLKEGKSSQRIKITAIVCIVIFILGLPVTLDGLGSGTAGGAAIDIPAVMFGMSEVRVAFDCWLDFYDMISEGLLMPLGTMLMCLFIGWIIGTKAIVKELEETPKVKIISYRFWEICFKYIAPVIVFIVFLGQIDDFFGLGIF